MLHLKKVMLYLKVWQACAPDGINCQVRASKAHKIRLLGEEAVSKQPPERQQRNMFNYMRIQKHRSRFE